MGFIHRLLPISSNSLIIILGFKALFSRFSRCLARAALATDEEDGIYNKDEFININNINNKDVLLVVRGSFSTIVGCIKAKRVKGKESWIFNYSYRIYRAKVLY